MELASLYVIDKSLIIRKNANDIYIYRFNGISYVPQRGDQDSGVKSYKDTVAIGKGEFKHHIVMVGIFFTYTEVKK